MSTYRKRPVEVEARQLTPDTLGSVVRFVPIEQFAAAGEDERGVFIEIRTLEGVVRASDGDWIIRGVKGEMYPCKPDIFAETYEPAVVSAPVQPTTRADETTTLQRIREVVRRLAAHAVGFQDVLDESDRGPWGRTVGADIAELRRMAGEEQPATETPEPATSIWTVEGCYDADHDKWHGVGNTYMDRDEAMAALQHRARNDPDHVKHFKFRLVRATTTYTVEQPAAETREADPDCGRCEGSGLDPDASFVNNERTTWTPAPCSECFPDEDDPVSTKRVRHSGPDTKFCVLCQSGEHERVDDEQPATETQAPSEWPWNLTSAFQAAVNAPTYTESATATLAFAHELAEHIRRERDEANIPGSPATPDFIRGMSHAANLADPEDQ